MHRVDSDCIVEERLTNELRGDWQKGEKYLNYASRHHGQWPNFML